MELGSERVRKKVLLCPSSICSQGNIENFWDVGGQCGSRVSARHKALKLKGGSEEYARAWRMVVDVIRQRGSLNALCRVSALCLVTSITDDNFKPVAPLAATT